MMARFEITKADIMAPADYAKIRADRRKAVTAIKRNRRISVGPFATGDGAVVLDPDIGGRILQQDTPDGGSAIGRDRVRRTGFLAQFIEIRERGSRDGELSRGAFDGLIAFHDD